MKFQPDQLAGTNVISRHDAGRVWINADEWTTSVVVPWKGQPRAWDASSFEAIAAGHFERILDLQPELVIFGSGGRLRFVSPSLQRALIDRRIGVETMDTVAACRTFNVLTAEGRAVVAALLIEAPV